jgi:two-component system chemotaxis sensor kinase CheA
MKIDLSQFRQTFLQESAEHTTSMEDGLLRLRSSPEDAELLNAIFRSAHSIKGGAGSFGLTALVRFTHALENLLDRMRSMEIPATEHVIGLLLKSVDVLREMLSGAEQPESAADLVKQIEAITSTEPAAAHASMPLAVPVSGEDTKLFTIEFIPSLNLFSSGTNPLLLVRNLAALGTVKRCEIHTGQLPPLSDLDPTLCYLSWTVELITTQSQAEILEVFEFVEHLAEIRIQCVDIPREISEQVATAKSSVDPSADIAFVPDSAPAAIGDGSRSKKAAAVGESSSIRVGTDKVDKLIDLVGELVIAHVMTKQTVDEFTIDALPKLREAVAAMERNTRELHERVMAIRMMPVGSLFQRYTRIVYDIAQATGKQITLETDGEETEIDKSMLELLGDPLTHIIRNAADHGIESPADRIAAGKPEQGTIRLTACHRAGKVLIEISDDGAGIDTARVRTKAVERGLISPDAQLTEDQLRMLIFEPGFSTRDEVSDLSGRGVGMDVVRRNVQKLSGMVSLDSDKGHGSTVSIELPLTLAILEGLLVRVDDRTLVLPLLSVVETVSPTAGQLARIAEQGEAIVIREEVIPLLSLRRFLGMSEQLAEVGGGQTAAKQVAPHLVVIVEAGLKKIGLAVDELLGQQQVVVKSLERHLHKVEGLMGATILGDGCVAPIVDVAGIASMNLFSLRAPAKLNLQPDQLAVPA